jgi:prepilin signal peptidase PulO-like enzyme (type II secretory pathway)
MGSLALAEDVVLLIIPIVIVWRMKLVRAEKVRITVLFAFGGLYVLLNLSFLDLRDMLIEDRVCIFGILRVVELVHYQEENLTGRFCSSPKIYAC